MNELSAVVTPARTNTPLGDFHLLFEGERLVYAGFSDPAEPRVKLPAILRRRLLEARKAASPAAGSKEYPAHVQQAVRQIQAYFSGRSQAFDIPLQLYGSRFQKAVWNRLLEIESGATSTYGRVAAGCGYPRAVRAVGSAVGSNPISIIVPCHRVLPAGGGVGNYGGGPDKKEFLLKLEHALD
ncbi:MAG: methylated-DNA--[protein]-cysteine S-methyltransferase [Spirochaetia bacterium]